MSTTEIQLFVKLIMHNERGDTIKNSLMNLSQSSLVNIFSSSHGCFKLFYISRFILYGFSRSLHRYHIETQKVVLFMDVFLYYVNKMT